MKKADQFSDLNEQDAATAREILAAFADVEMAEVAPQLTTTSINVVALPSKKRKRSNAWFAMAASVAFVLAISASLSPQASSVAWANEPSATSARDISQAAKACGAVIERGLGDLEYSGSASAGQEVDTTISAVTDELVQPTALPPLAVLDVRGDGALAVYQNSDWNVVCLLKREGEVWKDQGLSVTSATQEPQAGALFVSRTSWVGGDSVSVVSGATPAATNTVNFTLTNGETVTASVLNGTFAAWFPGDTEIVSGSLKFS